MDAMAAAVALRNASSRRLFSYPTLRAAAISPPATLPDAPAAAAPSQPPPMAGTLWARSMATFTRTVVNIRTVRRDSAHHRPRLPFQEGPPSAAQVSTSGRVPPPTDHASIRIQDSKYKFNSIMVLDALSSPHRRSQNTFFMPPSKKSQSSRDDLGSWSALIERHRFLLTTLVVLAFLCTIYLYFAVTLGAPDACSGLADTEREECLAKSVMQHGKLKFH